MTRIMYVGDPHVKPRNLKESEKLKVFILEKAIEFKIERLVFLGDLLDTHDIVHLGVFKFWENFFDELTHCPFQVIVLVGNHDISGDYLDNYSALRAFDSKNIRIVSHPVISGKFGYMPYIHNNETFIAEANKLADQGATVIVSHTSYTGSQYDSGMLIPDAVDPDRIDPRVVKLISGHIHTEQFIGRVWYPGTPRWLTKACANKDKGIWIVDHLDSGAIETKCLVSTKLVCTPIVSLTWKEGEDRPNIPVGAKVDIELIGSSQWISKEKLALVGLASISSKCTDVKNKGRERKSGKSLREFVLNHYPMEDSKRVRVIKFMEGLNFV